MDVRAMAVPSKEELQAIWYAALASKHGIAVPALDTERLKASLLWARASTYDPELSSLSLCASRTAPGAELWIVKNAPQGRAIKKVQRQSQSG